jgi:hypothetical protein
VPGVSANPGLGSNKNINARSVAQKSVFPPGPSVSQIGVAVSVIVGTAAVVILVIVPAAVVSDVPTAAGLRLYAVISCILCRTCRNDRTSIDFGCLASTGPVAMFTTVAISGALPWLETRLSPRRCWSGRFSGRNADHNPASCRRPSGLKLDLRSTRRRRTRWRHPRMTWLIRRPYHGR